MNELRDKFLVEQEGGCWHTPHSGLICTKCKICTSGIFNPDFSKWENFGRLLELAEKKDIGIHIKTNEKTIVSIQETGFYKFSDTGFYKNPSNIPTITIHLIAKALGWKEVEK